MNTKKTFLLLIAIISLNACTHTKVPLGTIPQAEPPTKSASNEAVQGLVGIAASQGYKVTQRGSEYVRVKRIWDRLTVAAGAKQGLWPVFIVDAGEDVNAAAVNGAAMEVHKELVHRVKDDAQLATVLSHEMGHILAKHHENAEKQEANAEAVEVGASVLGSAVSTVGRSLGWALPGLAGSATEATASLVGDGAFVKSFSRSQEYDADQVGLMIMAKAGYNPNSALAFWKNANEILGNYDSTSFFSTHPSHEDRLENLEEALPYAMNYYKPSGKVAKKAAATKAKDSKDKK